MTTEEDMDNDFDQADDSLKACERECFEIVLEAQKRPITPQEADVVLWHLGFLPRQREFRA